MIAWATPRQYFLKFEIWENARVLFFKFPQQQKMFWNAHPWCFKFQQTNDLGNQAIPQIQIRANSHSHDSWHKWEDGSRKVNMNAINFSQTSWNFCPVMNQAVRKPCFSTSIARGQNPRFPDAAGAGRTLKSRSRPFATHPGMKCFCKGKARYWFWSELDWRTCSPRPEKLHLHQWTMLDA